jgi:hypothetical protein
MTTQLLKKVSKYRKWVAIQEIRGNGWDVWDGGTLANAF